MTEVRYPESLPTYTLPSNGSALGIYLMTHSRDNATVATGMRHSNSYHKNKDSNVRTAHQTLHP